MLRPAFVDDTLAARRRARARDRGRVRRHRRVRGPLAPPACTTRPPLLRGGAVIARYAKCKLPELRRVRRAPDLRSRGRRRRRRGRGHRRRSVDLRGRLAAGPTVRPLRRDADRREPQRLAVPPREGRGARGRAASARGRDRRLDRLRQRRRRARTSWCSTAARSCVAPDGSVACRAARFDEDLLVVQIDDDGFAADAATAVAGRARGRLSRARARHARLRAQERLRARSCSGSPAGSTPRWSPRSPWTPSGRSRSTRSRCRACTRARAASPTPRTSPAASASSSRPFRSPTSSAPTRSSSPTSRPSKGLAAENLQARIRGNDLMALSNRFGWLVLATGNKSEYAVGYSTLYGDMAGGFAPIKDVPKTLVYDLCRWRNAVEPAAADPRLRPDEAAVGGAPTRPAGHRLPAAVRGARPDHRRLRGGRPRDRRDRRGGHRGRGARSPVSRP